MQYVYHIYGHFFPILCSKNIIVSINLFVTFTVIVETDIPVKALPISLNGFREVKNLSMSVTFPVKPVLRLIANNNTARTPNSAMKMLFLILSLSTFSMDSILIFSISIFILSVSIAASILIFSVSILIFSASIKA
mmetsp:Transcript_6717/g.9334  ORF Transcript_6717/g.9334 Transcript_6717/m.9334 type:complete len:136 (-) Transcript_6717:1945-2352(-)